ncbi:MAG: GrpB family protein [Francisellaceae bacterium]|nr:GrpB family protein [Francisellaceae bacterium]
MGENDKVSIIEYQPSWPNDFEKISNKIKSLLGDNICGIEHIGSTSIPNMPAKDIIDIQLAVKDFSGLDLIDNKLSSVGFELIENFKQDHVPFKEPECFEVGYEKRFFKGYIDDLECNLHVRVLNAENWNYAVDFRDFLIDNENVSIAYAQIKERISSTKVNLRDYCLIKDPVCDLIYLLFVNWKENV